MNCIVAIHPYKENGLWVFNDPEVGLLCEPFVKGADDIIEQLTRGLDDPEAGFTLRFSADPFPGHHVTFEWRRAELGGGNWYYSAQLAAEGWLCPALFKYFDAAPQHIYAQFTNRKQRTLGLLVDVIEKRQARERLAVTALLDVMQRASRGTRRDQ